MFAARLILQPYDASGTSLFRDLHLFVPALSDGPEAPIQPLYYISLSNIEHGSPRAPWPCIVSSLLQVSMIRLAKPFPFLSCYSD